MLEIAIRTMFLVSGLPNEMFWCGEASNDPIDANMVTSAVNIATKLSWGKWSCPGGVVVHDLYSAVAEA